MMVVNTARKFLHLIPEEEQGNILAGCWLHDVIEDCRETYNDVKKETNETVAELVYALTNEKGKNRKERANDKYYEGIRNTPYATFIKLCDRIANVEYSYATESRMFEMYCKENENFLARVGEDGAYNNVVEYLNGICKINKI
jgi:(p)ppGpp synthase/HD superfamily hydrolase